MKFDPIQSKPEHLRRNGIEVCQSSRKAADSTKQDCTTFFLCMYVSDNEEESQGVEGVVLYFSTGSVASVPAKDITLPAHVQILVFGWHSLDPALPMINVGSILTSMV